MQRTLGRIQGALLMALMFAPGCSDGDSAGTDAGANDSRSLGDTNSRADGGPDVGACATSGIGTLTVNVTGLPAGVSANVKLLGPSGTQEVTATQTFPSVAAGPYTFTAERVTVADPIVRTVYRAALSSAGTCVGSTPQVLTVSYQAIETSNKLWVTVANAPADDNLAGFAAAVLGAAGAPAANVAAKIPGKGDLVFDKDGNVWAVGATTADPHLLRVPTGVLSNGGSKTPDRAITLAGLGCLPPLAGLAFDEEGSLWLASPCSKQVLRLGAAQLTSSGEVTPAQTITLSHGPQGVAFDKEGNLWVAIPDDGKLLRFDAASLVGASSAALTVTVTTQTTGGSPLHAGWILFDAAGDLWTADFGGNVIFRLPAADLASSGNKELVPPVQVTLPVSALLEGMALDEGGGLWVTYNAGSLARLSPTQLGTSSGAGDPTVPERIVSSSAFGSADHLAFYPAPAALPLYHALP